MPIRLFKSKSLLELYFTFNAEGRISNIPIDNDNLLIAIYGRHCFIGFLDINPVV